MDNTPARNIIRLSRQEILEAGRSSIKFGQHTFMESLYNATPKVGVGTNGSALPPQGDLGSGYCFWLTMVYAYNGTQERKELWDKLCMFKRNIQGAWVICGDFNTVLVPAERLGGNNTVEEMEDFKACVDECEVADSPASGSFFTWCIFYHTPCVLQAFDDKDKKRRSFKYYNMWSQAENFKLCVQSNWKGKWFGTKMYILTRQLKNLKCRLRKLNKESFADIENNFHRAKMHLEYIQDRLRGEPQSIQLIEMERDASNSVRFLANASHEFLVQKSKVTWMEKGDSNTKYLHQVIKVRRPGTRLAAILPDIISENQSGFIKGRSIVENILICQDIVRCYNRRAASPRFMLKVDLQKAYDSVSWAFLEQMMNSLNFPTHMIHLIMECMSTATYSLVLNGDTFGHFKGAKGLRQGEPLSPLLFTVAMEYFSRILAYTTDTMAFKFHPMCGKLSLSHLMFADDLLLFSKGDIGSIMVLLRSFSTFSQASGLQMNATKTNAYFQGVLRKSKLMCCKSHDLLKDWQILVEKIITKIRRFGTKKLSYYGRLVNYLWDDSVDYIRVPPVGWDKVCSPKDEGGLGIRDSLSWNIVAIGKLVWGIYSCPDRLWVKWVHQVYLKGDDWNDYNPNEDVSWGWKVICRTKTKLAHGWCIPKHQFIGWLIARESLQLKDTLLALGIVPDATCLLCGEAEESHLCWS
ncbi:uncharacterized protein LOC141632401 [Silene latifolia]|uniref:uncharacterized protein LOC141632401 n=1 Tax=Silene latifolia TaxID=37657 RepID=UPI003D779C24